MPGPYIQDGHYVYGTMHNQPFPGYYNSSWYHREPPRRLLSSLLQFYDDGSVYVAEDKAPASYGEEVVRSKTAANIVNIESLAFRMLRIKLYAIKEEDDTDIVLELGKKYSITYMSEIGLKVATGILKIIDSSIPDVCTRYIGVFNETIATAWIGLDCSTDGNSDKRKIFIASIRGIEEVPVDDPTYIVPVIDTDELTDAQKLSAIYNSLPAFTSKINQILIGVLDNNDIANEFKDLDIGQKLDLIASLITSTGDSIEEKLEKYRNSQTIAASENEEP